MASITISHVADVAGVSMKTVSRVLNGEPNVSAATHAKVTAAVTALNYRPNISARSLAGTRSYLLGLLFDDATADYVSNLQFGGIQQCREAGYHLLIDRLDSNAADFADQVHMLLSNVRTDGFILSPPLSDNEVVLAALEASGTPYVRISPYRQVERGPYVNIDEAGAAFEMTSLLLGLGHTRIAFIKAPPEHGASHMRYGGYASALRSKGAPLLQDYVRQGDFTARSGIEAAEQLLTHKSRPTAVFASNDEMALGVMLVASKLGLRVPQDLSICGFDDMFAATLVWPQLTTVHQPVQELCAMAARLLISRDREPRGHLLDFNIVVRGSTGPAPN